jgi:hypothetical protein
MTAAPRGQWSGPSPGGAPSIEQELRNDPRGFFTRVAQARGLSPRRDVPILLDQEYGFWAALSERERHMPSVESDVDTGPFYLAFNFRAQPGSQKSGPGEVVDEQLLGFYDPFSHTAHVRATKVVLGKTDDDIRLTVAHELEHALQDQTFGLRLPGSGMTEEAQLAYSAVLEGDADVAALGHLAQVHRKPLRRILAQSADYIRGRTWEREMATDARSAALRRAPADERARLIFPYTSGLAFMSDLYRTGGFDLMNGAFRVPPISTEQVIHTDKYLAGEKPIPVRVPETPAGYKRVFTGQMGELLTSTFLRQCGAPAGAGAGWGGDSFAVVESSKSTLGLLWSTAWDDEASARTFEDTLQHSTACWAGVSSQASLRFADGALVKREGTRVAVVRGMSPALAGPAATSLLALVGKAPPAVPPFGALRVVPSKPKSSAARGRFYGPTYVNDYLGIVSPVPPEFTASLDKPAVTMSLKRSWPSFTLAALTLSDDLVSAESYFHDDNDFIRALHKEAPSLQFQFLRAGPVSLPLGQGIERLWGVVDSTSGVRLITVPICNGNGAYIVAEAWTDALGYQRLEEWLMKIQKSSPNPAPVCDELDP